MSGFDAADPSRRDRFSTIFSLTYEPLQRYVRRRGGGADTDDIVAETLTVVWRRLDDIPADAELPWTIGVARRCLANHRRTEQRRTTLVERVAAHLIEPAAVVDDELDLAMGQLDADQRELLHLWAWEGFAPREIAVVLGITANAASIRLHRARRDLAALLPERKNATVGGHTAIGTTEEEQ
jgi:RNA polymerase sigma-70 factor (ECF subfamily)